MRILEVMQLDVVALAFRVAIRPVVEAHHGEALGRQTAREHDILAMRADAVLVAAGKDQQSGLGGRGGFMDDPEKLRSLAGEDDGALAHDNASIASTAP